MNLEKLKDTARKYEQKEDWRRAIDVYLKAIQEFESGKEPHPDLSLYNRVGDLYMKVNDPAAAVRSYERAADLYTEQGFLNNAIALCGKILRVNPGRVQTYYKLAQIHARKNMLLEAKRNLIEYLERMNHAGELDAAFDAVKVFADHFPANQEIRFMLIELLRAASREDEARRQVEVVAQELESRGDAVGAQRTREQLDAAANEVDEGRAAASPSPGGLVFLDTGFAPAAPRATTPRSPIVERRTGTPSHVPKVAPLPETMPLIELTTFETAGEAEVARLDDLIEDVAASPADLASGEIDILLEPAFESADEDVVADAGPLEGLEVLTPPEDVDAPDGFVPEEPLPIAELLGSDESGAEPGLTELEVGEELEPLGELGTLEEFVVTGEFTALDREAAADEFFVADVEEPGLEFAPAGTATDEASVPELADEFASPPAEPGMATVDELEDLVLEDPENPDSHRRLGEALLLQGETSRASDEFELALSGYELLEHREQAEALVDLLITLHPDSVRYYQKRVEYSYRTGDRDRLLEAYLDLGDALLRMQADDKAAAVYGRVLEHDPVSPRARYGLQQLGLLVEDEEPVEEEALEEAFTEDAIAEATLAEDLATGAASAQAAAELAIDEALAETLEAERAVAPPPAQPKPAPRPVPVPAGDPLGFVDLGSLIIDDDAPRDTRMKGEQLETTGDEQRDFEEMLAQFKKGIDENVGHDDYEAHYDLGIAFKEMGLLDEAVAEFQKALRDPNGRLRTSEALGVAFFEKGQMAVAEAVLRRAVDTLDGGDDQKIGLIYWLGRACEAQGRLPEARQSYERAMAVDIQFMDLRDRVGRLSAAQPQ
jgi:tetratricopeptide (TPR) repeat protein